MSRLGRKVDRGSHFRSVSLLVVGVVVGAGAVYALTTLRPEPGTGELLRETAPAFTLPSTRGGTVSLSDYRGVRNVLLYFQEGIMCGPCWEQIEDIEAEYREFEALDIEVLTITVDPLNGLVKEADRRGITLPVLEDADLSVSTAYGMLNESMHPGSRPGHSFALVDKEGTLVWKTHYYPVDHIMHGMGMSKSGRMYVPVDELLGDVRAAVRGAGMPQEPEMDGGETGMIDHSMCQTPIHLHANFKAYFGGTPLNLSQRMYMDQAADVHLHSTVKTDDTPPGIPVGDIIHLHRENATLRYFLGTLDLEDGIRSSLANEAKVAVYVNGTLAPEGLDHVLAEGERILLTTGTADADEIAAQMASVTTYTSADKERFPGLFGGC